MAEYASLLRPIRYVLRLDPFQNPTYLILLGVKRGWARTFVAGTKGERVVI
jgi:hypothetical protein